MSTRKATEKAIALHLKDHVSVDVYQGTRGDVKEPPCVVVEVTSGDEVPIGSGNREVECMIVVQDVVDDSGDAGSGARFDAITNAVQEALSLDDLATQISWKVSPFHVVGIMAQSGPSAQYDTQEGLIGEVFGLRMIVAEVD